MIKWLGNELIGEIFKIGIYKDKEISNGSIKSKYVLNSMLSERNSKIENILTNRSKKKMFQLVISRSLTANIYLSAQLLHLFPMPQWTISYYLE